MKLTKLARVSSLLLWFMPLGVPGAQAQVRNVPFAVCAESNTWVRPSSEAQSKIWNDPRYRVGPTAYEWTHHFISSEADSASIRYHLMNLTGLWTETVPWRWSCPGRQGGEWLEVWVLLHRVKAIHRDGGVHTMVVERTDRGFQVIQFRRFPDSPDVTMRFVDGDGQAVE